MQSPDFSQNFFELFGLSPAFDIDPSRLRLEQQRLQTSYHPDRYVNSSPREKRMSVQMASWINQAYETLHDPVKRSRYLLEINGASMPDDSQTTSDAAFLMEQIELREEVEACRHSEDALHRCEQIASRLAERTEAVAREFVMHLEAKNLDAALLSSRKMQFIQRIQQQLAELQFDLEEI